MKNFKFLANQRQKRVRKKLINSSNRPRLTVFRSNKHIYAQIIDHTTGKILALASDLTLDKTSTKVEQATQVGTQLAKNALQVKIKTVTFDRGSYKYHGRVKALAQSARSQGLIF